MIEKILSEKEFVDSENGFLFRHIYSETEHSKFHSHDYYEIFLMIKGSVCHIVNSKKQTLTEGHLVFMRDFDVHNFMWGEEDYFEFLNISFSKKLFSSIVEYLGDDFPRDDLLSAEDPPLVALNPDQTQKLTNILTEMDQINQKPSSRLKIKSLLADVFVNYFLDYDCKTNNVPDWLLKTCEIMKKTENFIEGSKKMIEISGKSREHLSRSLQKYYKLSLTEFVNNLRLEYCADKLTKTNQPIIDICYNCGFENLSWFYKIFEKKYGTTPSKYRKKHESVKHPSRSE